MLFRSDKQRRAVFAHLGRGKVARLGSRQRGLSSARQQLVLEHQKLIRPSAQQQLVLGHQKLIHQVAKRYRGTGASYEDLVSEGQLGLLKAAKTFKPKKGVKFSTWAFPYIKQHVQRGLGKQQKIKVGERSLKKLKDKGLLPTPTAIAVAMAPDYEVASEGGIGRAFARATLSKLRAKVVKLPTNQSRVMLSRYWADGHTRPEPWTMRQVAKKLKISLASVSKYERQARARLIGKS